MKIVAGRMTRRVRSTSRTEPAAGAATGAGSAAGTAGDAITGGAGGAPVAPFSGVAVFAGAGGGVHTLTWTSVFGSPLSRRSVSPRRKSAPASEMPSTSVTISPGRKPAFEAGPPE